MNSTEAKSYKEQGSTYFYLSYSLRGANIIKLEDKELETPAVNYFVEQTPDAALDVNKGQRKLPHVVSYAKCTVII